MLTQQEIQLLKDISLQTKSQGISRKLKCKHGDIFLKLENMRSTLNCITISEVIYLVIHDLSSIPMTTCKHNIRCRFISLDAGYAKLCPACSKYEALKNGMIRKYGTSNAAHLTETQEKKKQTCIDRYGVESTNQLDSVKNKKKQTLIKHFGEEGLAHSSIQDKKRNTCIERYGVEHHTKLESVQEKRRQTCYDKYNTDNVMHVPEIKTKVSESWYHNSNFLDYVEKLVNARGLILQSEYHHAHDSIEVKCKKCGTVFSILWNSFQQGGGVCPGCFPLCQGRSKMENDIAELIASLGIDILCNKRDIISPYELDIFIPSHNIAIEFCGLWCHSSGGNAPYLIPADRHITKLRMCEDAGIRLITIFEDEWILRKEVVMSKLLIDLNQFKGQKLGGRLCTVGKTTSKSKRDFLQQYHLQGDRVSTVNLCLKYFGSIISVMTFTKLRDHEYELSRYCCKPNYLIMGGASKLLSYFKTNYTWTNIFTYADRRWSNGNLYTSLGFESSGITDPNYWYWGNGIIGRAHRLNYSKSQLTSMKNFSDDLTEKQIMALEGYAWIYDCGNYKFTMVNTGNNL